MGSLNAQRVAHKVSEVIQKHELVDIGDIIVKEGYAVSTSKKPSLVTNTKSYKAAMAIMERPLLEGIQAEINRAKLALSRKDLSQEDVKTLTYMIDVLTKNYQLLSGGATERQVFVLPSQIIDKNVVEVKPLLDNTSQVIDDTSNNGSVDTSSMSHNIH